MLTSTNCENGPEFSGQSSGIHTARNCSVSPMSCYTALAVILNAASPHHHELCVLFCPVCFVHHLLRIRISLVPVCVNGTMWSILTAASAEAMPIAAISLQLAMYMAFGPNTVDGSTPTLSLSLRFLKGTGMVETS